MIDKKKLTIFGVIVAVIVAAIITTVVWAYNNSEPAPVTEPQTTTSPSPSETAEPSPSTKEEVFEDELSFDGDMEQIAGAAAKGAATWDSIVTEDVRQQDYLMADFSTELAESFEPVWAEIYDPELVSGFIVDSKIERVWLTDVAGKKGEHTYRVGVLIEYKPHWMEVRGGASGSPKGEATWWVTVDEKTGKATKIDQPTKAELNIDLD